jgi:translation initiation factor IF-3
VEIAPGASPPVCRIVDFSKFKYEQKKKNKELKAKAVKVVIKEIRWPQYKRT